MMPRRLAFLLLSLLAVLAGQRPAAAVELVVDLSTSLVEISTSFVGSDLLLFGATDGPGDVVVVVRGPVGREVVRRKERVLGIWVNSKEVTFGNVPSFYAVASSRPLDDVLLPEVRTAHQIGYSRLILIPYGSNVNSEETVKFREALIREKERQELFTRTEGTVRFLANRLFRTVISFPATVPTGSYEVDIYLVRDRKIATKQTVNLTVRKVGLEATVWEFAHRQSLAYGILAVLIAVVAGWIANAAFRRT